MVLEEHHYSLLDLAGLKIELEENLGKNFDFVTFNSLHPLLIYIDGQKLLI